MTLQTLDAASLIDLFKSWKELFAEQREFLIALDGKVGDSDLGITMSKSFAAAAEALEVEGETAGIAKLLRTAGATMARTAPSTMGTLTATGFLRASKAVEGRDALGTADMAAFWRAYRDGVAERGKAKVGDVFKSRSIIGSEFEVGLQAETEVAGKPAIIPTITGRGFTFGLSQVALDPFDPMAEGFAMTDVWGPSAGDI